jgi:hypothetical protein
MARREFRIMDNECETYASMICYTMWDEQIVIYTLRAKDYIV